MAFRTAAKVLDSIAKNDDTENGSEPRPELSPYGVRAERLGRGFIVARIARNFCGV